ncbi:hypothetical protein DACRYDRAFT_109288 [Dacryopinax primogenitus]|uniref:AB hydrolase-1 domain-containing protein n=1 Tax=Dacryopinax primogenitus (strain DJM 731) TaxID=1858805 RepID=M5FUF9_DACPD|nr:uncharacterized protein DACRYDRAFT_109288 [Dacryopinax primogenitus]EJT99863.1 hypothetical protein DACRYDRAFT_109288 [Dacryopinax primogenitus]
MFSPTVAWRSCPDLTEYDCAYLSVPLDYLNPSPDETVSLALRRLPASAPKDERLGTLFVNPGGPGGSGTAALVNYGQDLNIILKGRYDILSWIPKTKTTPYLGCYPTDFDEWIGAYKEAQLGLPFELGNNSLSWFEKVDAFYLADVASCTNNGNQKMLKASSTAYTARDILSILQAIGEDERGLQYWGFRYGTILGATFAAMFPEYAYRLVLDGVANSNFFTNNPFDSGRSAMDDTNKVWEGFFSECALAGPGRCPLAEPGLTADDIRASIEALIDSLRARPLPVSFSGKFSGIITASDVKTAIFQALYKPTRWADLAKAFSDAKKGDGAALAIFIGEPALTERREPTDNVFRRHMVASGTSRISNAAVMCGDVDPRVAHSIDTPEEFMEYSKELSQLSITGETWTLFAGRCRLWNITAFEAYRGPWTVEDGLQKTK